MSFPALLATIPPLQDDASNWAIFTTHFREAMQAMHRWGHFDGTAMCPIPKDAAHPTNTENQAIKEWEREDAAARYHLFRNLPPQIVLCLLDCPKTAKARWDGLTKELGQPGLEDTRKEGLTGEPPAVIGQGGSQRRRRRGKCHSCGEEGHRARDCRAPREEPATPLIAQEQSGASVQPETSPAHLTHAADLEGEGCPLAKEGDTLVQIVDAEVVPSRQHPEDPTQEVHAQTASAEPEAISGEPGAIEEVAHEHNDRAELDLQGQPGNPNANTPKGVAHPELDSMPGEDIYPNANAPMHLEGMGPEVMLEKGGIARENASVEEDRVPRIELQESGVSHLATLEEDMFLTSSSSSSPPTTSEAARTQRLQAVNTGTPASPVPDHSADLELPPHDTPPPNEAAEPPIHQPPEQIQAPTEVGGPLKSLTGEASQRAMGQMGLTSAQAHEGKTPIGEAHGRPPDLTDPQRRSSIIWEPAFIVPKARVRVHQARRPILDKGACTRPDPWPSPGIVIVDPDTCTGSASQLEGEQNINLPPVGCKLHAAPSTPQHFSFSPSLPIPLPLDTLVHKNPPCGEGAATERRTTKGHHPKPWKPPDAQAEDLHESGGASASDDPPILLGCLGDPDPFGLAGMAVNADVGEVEPSRIDAYEQGGAPLLVGVAPALAEDTVGVGPADEAKTACAAKPKALVSWAQDKAGRRHEDDVPPQEALPQKGKRNPKALSRERELERRLNKGEHEPIRPQGEVLRQDEGALETPLRNHQREHATILQGVARCEVEGLPQEGEHVHEPPPEVLLRKGEHKIETPSRGEGKRTETLPQGTRMVERMPQGCTDEVDCKPSWPLRGPSHKAVPSTWEGAAPWDPGGRPPRERTLKSKGPVEAMNTAAGIDAPQRNVALGIIAHKKTPGCAESNQSASTIPKSQPRTFIPFSIRRPGLLSSRSPFVMFSSRGPYRGHGVVPGDAEQRHRNKDKAMRPFGGHHTHVTRCHTRPHARSGALAEKPQCAATAA